MSSKPNINNSLNTDNKTWQDLLAYKGEVNILDLFAKDQERAQKYSIKIPRNFNSFSEQEEDNQKTALFCDYSKQDIDDDILSKLLELAFNCDIEKKRKDLFTGAIINCSENKPALHVLARSINILAKEDIEHASTEDLHQKFKDISPDILLKNMLDLEKSILEKGITDVVNIGTGGSYIGPQMVCKALKPFARSNSKLNIHFVSNMDGAHLWDVLEGNDLKPDTTAFLISSKSYSTQETLENAKAALEWSQNIENFYALTASREKAVSWGIKEENILALHEAIGGRFSVWSATGFPIYLLIGAENYAAFLQGASCMDMHYLKAPLEKNLPVILALIGIWQHNIQQRPIQGVMAYNYHLRDFIPYIQQLDMESCGKSTDISGNLLHYTTSPLIFGGLGTDSQHSFFQFLHQSNTIIPCDFIISAQTYAPYKDHQSKLLANALAQTQALMSGKQAIEQKNSSSTDFPGNRPSTSILLGSLDPFSLGMLMALYEHKTFTQSVIWNVNCFDQPGVELGKKLAKILQENSATDIDPSTQAQLNHIKNT